MAVSESVCLKERPSATVCVRVCGDIKDFQHVSSQQLLSVLPPHANSFLRSMHYVALSLYDVKLSFGRSMLGPARCYLPA